MKEKDTKINFDNSDNLDNILIDGIIKEAEQDNADFEAAMRNISDEAFNEIANNHIADAVDNFATVHFSVDKGSRFRLKSYEVDDSDDEAYSSRLMEPAFAEYEDSNKIPVKSSSNAPVARIANRGKRLRPWITTIVASAAIIILIIIPSYNTLNAKLCDGALLASQEYITPSKGSLDLYTSPIDEIKEELPNLERHYQHFTSRRGKKSNHHEYTYYERDDVDMSWAFETDFQETAWELAVAYLRLHKKGDALRVLKELESQTRGTPMGDHCKKLIEYLE